MRSGRCPHIGFTGPIMLRWLREFSPCIGGTFLPHAAAMALTILLVHPAAAETYRWTDAGGNTFFTDNPASIPRKYLHEATTDADITLADANVRQEVEESRRTAARLEQETAHKILETRRRELAEEHQQKLKADKEKLSAEIAAKKLQATPRKRAVG